MRIKLLGVALISLGLVTATLGQAFACSFHETSNDQAAAQQTARSQGSADTRTE
jgi:hypothetical protein